MSGTIIEKGPFTPLRGGEAGQSASERRRNVEKEATKVGGSAEFQKQGDSAIGLAKKYYNSATGN